MCETEPNVRHRVTQTLRVSGGGCPPTAHDSKAATGSGKSGMEAEKAVFLVNFESCTETPEGPAH